MSTNRVLRATFSLDDLYVDPIKSQDGNGWPGNGGGGFPPPCC